MKTVVAALVFVTTVSLVHAQEPQAPAAWKSSFGIGAAIQGSFMSSQFRYLPGYLGCNPNPYETGTGTAKGLQGYWKYAASNRWFFGGGIGYIFDNGILAVQEVTSINLDGIAVPATIDHTIDVSLARLTLGPGVGYNITDRLSGVLGVELGYLISPSFSSREHLTTPRDRGVFEENGARIRNQQSGELPDANKVQSALTLGVRYSLPLNAIGSLALVPSANYHSGFTNIVRGLNWRESSLGVGLAIEYTPSDQLMPPKPQPEQRRDTIPTRPTPPALLASITAAGVDTAGRETSGLVRLRIEELYEISKVPLIPYVFFNSRSDTLDGRYMTIEEHESAQLENKPGTDRLTLYTDILNLIGERMQQHPSARLTLTGCTDPSERPHAVSLALNRANTVRDYLGSSWNVDPKRIVLRSRELPDHPSPTQDTDGQAENRRVEIASTDPSILGPVSVSDTLRSATPAVVRFHPTAVADARVDRWVIEAEQQGKLLARFNGNGEPPPSIDWTVANDQSSIPRAPGVLDYRFRVSDTKNQIREAKGAMEVEQYTLRTKKKLLADDGKAEIEKYSLVLFDFNSSELWAQNRSVLAEIKARLQLTSQVTITGYTDRIGERVVNDALALDRAQCVARALDLDPAVCRISAGVYPYSNVEPEGRFYSRTVEIIIRNSAGPRE